MQQQIIALLPMILVFVVIYFFFLRPHKKQEKERRQMLSNLKKGDKVITIGGLHGTIIDLSEKKVILKVNDQNRLTFERAAVNTVVETKKEKKEKEKDKKDEEK